ncbi:MAG: ABC transporter substrate-binding protein [Aeropyrum sp.]|nr:ABC transporter substrate-binding protein [Aeropyrum sp.]MCE4616640.1 ABC transporter substrate-binding protein [Aeropyrum sp.]
MALDTKILVIALAALIVGAALGAVASTLLAETPQENEEPAGEAAVTATPSQAASELSEFCSVGYGLLDKIKERGVLRVGTSADWPPYEYIDSEGNFAGIDIELAKRIAEGLGVELEIVDMKFAALFQAVQSGKVDLVIADVAMKPERLQAVDFTIPYRCETSKVIIVKSGDAQSYSGYDWLAGKKIGVQAATVEEELATKYFGDKAEIVAFDRVYPEMTLALKTGRIDAMVTAPDVGEVVLAMEEGLEIVDSIPYFGCSTVVVPHCAFSLKKEVSQIIWDLLQSGELQEIVEKETAVWLEQQGS